VQRRRRGMIIARQRARGLQAPGRRHVAPPGLARIGGGGGYQHDAPLELPFSFEGAIGSWSVSRSNRNRKLPGGHPGGGPTRAEVETVQTVIFKLPDDGLGNDPNKPVPWRHRLLERRPRWPTSA